MDYAFALAVGEAQELVAQAFHSVTGKTLENARVSVAKNADAADIASACCFEQAKLLGRNPVELAAQLAGKITLGKKSLFHSVQAANGYVNFSYSPLFYHNLLAQISKQGRQYGSSKSGKGQTVVVEYSSPNIGKPMHIGHIRSTILGDSMASLLEYQGYKVIRSNYLCEAGAQTAKLLLAVQQFGLQRIRTEKDLLEYYVKIHQELEKKPELEPQVQALIAGMENGDAHVLADLKKVREVSVEPFDRNYALLDVKFTETVFDSDYVEDGKKLVAECVKAGIAFKDNDGEIVGDLESKGLPNLVILRSNGTTLYSTRDLGLADLQYRKYKFDTRVYITASEQNTHFSQVFALLKALGKPYAEKLRHFGFGLIFLKEGRISTRKGQVVLLEDVLNDAVENAKKEVQSRQDYDADAVEEIARSVGVASLKYAILRIQLEKNITFDPASAVSFEGNTAAYLQYMCVRCHNVFRKGGLDENKLPALPSDFAYNDAESRLLALLAQFPTVAQSAASSYSPQTICDYAFKVATAFSVFYAASPVLKAESEDAKAARLHVVKSTQTVLETALGLLGISVPDKM